MKKLIFLISLCLLSQNFTIAAENTEYSQNKTTSAPLPLTGAFAQAIDAICNSKSNESSQIYKRNIATASNVEKSAASHISGAAPIPAIVQAPVSDNVLNSNTTTVSAPIPNQAKTSAAKNSSVQKNNVKIAQNTKPQAKIAPTPQPVKTSVVKNNSEQKNKVKITQSTKQTAAAAPIPNTQKTSVKTNISAAQENKSITQTQKTVSNPVKNTAPIPVPAVQKSKPAEENKIHKQQTSNQQPPTAKKQEYPQQNKAETAENTQSARQSAAGIPPIPKSGEKLKQEYREEVADRQKYKFYEDEELQNAANPQPKEEKKLNLRVNKKSDRPPVIVEDNLSDPNDNTQVRATITKVEFTPSRVFSEEELQKLASPLLSQPVTLDDIKKVVDGITRCYILGDYATSKAYLPPQDLSDGVLKINLFEGTVGKVTVKDNRWTKTGYIKNRVAPTPGDLLKVGELEKDVILFNKNNAVKLKVGLSAGEEPGQTDITLNTEDPFPFHLAFLVDNQGRQTIGTTRWGGMITADSLFGHRDRMSLGGYLGSGNRVGFADYNFPLNKYGTRLGASVSAGNISVVNGPLRDFGIGGTSQIYSVYLTHPLIDKVDFNLGSYTSANIKRSTTDISGVKLPTLGTFSLTQGFTARKDTEKGIWYTGHYGSVGFEALGGDEDFFKYEGNIMRLHDFGHGIIGQFRVAGQYSPQDRLPWMEQFQIGGMSTVRGYSEGLLLGKSGYLASAEIITPLPFLPKAIGSDRLGYIYPREMIKGAVFMDHGMVFPYKGGQSVDSGEFLMSWGLGLRVNLRKDVAARFYWGFGLNNKYDVDQKLGRFHFDITCAPDIGRVVADRHPKQKKKKENL